MFPINARLHEYLRDAILVALLTERIVALVRHRLRVRRGNEIVRKLFMDYDTERGHEMMRPVRNERTNG